MNDQNVYEKSMKRIELIFKEFDNIYISFSGGKDSGVMLNLCIQYIRENNLSKRIGVFHLDYEVQYNETLRYIDRVFAENKDIMDIYRICVPFKVSTCTSMYQTYWRPWDNEYVELWVREMPLNCFTEEDFPSFNKDMWDYDFQIYFASWYHEKKKANKTCCLIGIRTQESLQRWRTIHGNRRIQRYCNLKWTHQVADNICNAYPIYDWLTTDIWTANGRFEWDYNRLYDLYWQAGVSIEKQRVSSPFISEARESLALYKAIDPDMWGKMLCRVNGVNFTALYGNTSMVAKHKAVLPPGYTWESYMHFLLSTLPASTRLNYQQKLSVSINFWRSKGGCLPKETIEKLQEYGIKIEIMEHTNYNTDKKPVKMEYQDDIDLPGFKNLPTFRRMCICILKNDHLCKYMGFSMTKKELENRKAIMDRYHNIYG